MFIRSFVFFVLLGIVGSCAAELTTPAELREWDAVTNHEIHLPYSAVVQNLKRMGDECMNKEFGTDTNLIGGDGSTQYVPTANIGPTKAEFYTQWYSNTPGYGEGLQWILYVADVTPKGEKMTKVVLYVSPTSDWAQSIIPAWGRGEDAGCPILSGFR
ncbi:MAG TPA: hypothetical protein VGD24_06100 [Gallionella sp.]